MATATRRRSMKPKKTTPVPRARKQTTMRAAGARGAVNADPLLVVRDQLATLSTRIEKLERIAGMRPALEHASSDGGPK